MLWGEHHAALNTRLWESWEHRRKVEYKLRCRVCDYRKVAIVALGNLLIDLYLNARLLVFGHSRILFIVYLVRKDMYNFANCKMYKQE